MRPSKRQNDQIRDLKFEIDPVEHAEGSCMIHMGNTHVLCTASYDDHVPPWRRGHGKGWVTAEYGMLPRSTHSRMRREAAHGKQSGRTQEIQRLIGRSLRAVVDLRALGECQFVLDCDVIQADGGTRTASITGAWVALKLAIGRLQKGGLFSKSEPLKGPVSAISCGLYKDQVIADLDYEEDSNAQADANFAIGSGLGLIEVQMTGEEHAVPHGQFLEMLTLAQSCCAQIQERQLEIVASALAD